MKKTSNDRSFKDRWGSNTTARGWTAVPNILINKQRALDLNSTEMNILIILLNYYWEKGRNPYPTKRTIAELINKTPSTVQRSMAGMEKKKLLKRIKRTSEFTSGQGSNEYDLQPLVSILNDLSKEEIKFDEQKKQEKSRRNRGYGTTAIKNKNAI